MAAPGSPTPGRGSQPLGVVLAGGLGRRIGGSKAIVELDHRPLISYPVEAVWRALGNVVIVAKIGTDLPSAPGVSIWIEPEEPRHPLTGIVHALTMAEGRPVLVCASDMPLVTPELIRAIAQVDAGRASAVVASYQRQLQPLLACYQPSALEPLAGASSTVSLREAVAGLEPVLYEVEDPDLLFNVNSPDDLLQAAAMLDRRRSLSRRG
jgi:molybdenum cofactor guanylyltransferase